MNTFARRFFYLVAFLDWAMGIYVRWIEENRGEAGYWLAHAIIAFLVGYILFRPADTRTKA